jgi:hypothetical protein
MEALRLRVHDVDFQHRQITVRQGKGGKDRRTMLPATVGPCRGVWQGGAALRTGAEVSACPSGVGVAMGVPATPPLDQCRQRRAGAAPPGSQPDPESGAASGARLRNRDTCHLSHLPALVSHPPAGAGARHPHDSGAGRPQRRQHHHDLHARAESAPIGGGQLRRPFVTERTIIGGSAHQRGNGSGLGKAPSGADGPKGARLTTDLHRRQQQRSSTSYDDPSI